MSFKGRIALLPCLYFLLHFVHSVQFVHWSTYTCVLSGMWKRIFGPSKSWWLLVHPLYCFSLKLLIAAAKSLQPRPTLCDPIDGRPPGSPVPGILQARILEWVAISFSNAWKWSQSEVAQSSPTLSDPMDCSPTASSVHGIFQARVLEWGAIAFSNTDWSKSERKTSKQYTNVYIWNLERW